MNPSRDHRPALRPGAEITDDRALRVLLTTEGTYPYYEGGVSVVCDQLVRGLAGPGGTGAGSAGPLRDASAVEFEVLAVVANPNVHHRYEQPANATFHAVPLWGTEYLEEFFPVRGTIRRHLRPRPTSPELRGAIEAVIDEMVFDRGNSDRLASNLLTIARASREEDYRQAAHQETTWTFFLDCLRHDETFRHLPLDQTLEGAKALWRSLSLLAYPLPPVDIAHSTAAAFCAIPCIIAKRDQQVPFVLTEHGVYLRERILDLVRVRTSSRERILLTNIYRSLVRLCYSEADRILPVCEFNVGWEEALDPSKTPELRRKVEVVHNGVDVDRFPVTEEPEDPVIAFVGRIDPLKDVITLIEAVDLVRKQVPPVKLRLWGAASSAEYESHCRRAVDRLGLGEQVTFEGQTSRPAEAYAASQVVALSSVSEGMPLSLLEAMASSRPVVSTSVGAVPDVLGSPELEVDPRDVRGLAAALVRVLTTTSDQRRLIGERNRRRVAELFGDDRFLATHRRIYREMITEPRPPTSSDLGQDDRGPAVAARSEASHA